MPTMIPPNVRAVCFDAVGTLLFPEPSAPELYSSVAARHGFTISPAEVQARFLAAYRAEEAIDQLAGWITSETREIIRWRRIVTESLAGVDDPEACFRELFHHFSRANAWRVYSRAAHLFAVLLEREIILGLGSNYDARLWSVIEGTPELAPLQDRAVISATVGFRKPAREFFRAVAQLTNCEPDEVSFVGDDFENDYEGARIAGLHAIHFDPSGNDARAQCRVADLSQLLD